jgi:ABC-type amino acid transport substrate-binding protein
LNDFTKEGYLFGIRQNFFYTEEFNGRLKNDAEFKRHFIAVARIGQNLHSVKEGRMTGCIGDSLLTNYEVRKNSDFKEITMVHLPFFRPEPVYFGVSRKTGPDKIEKLKRSYEILNKKGEFKKIIRKWEK